jgi:cellulose synthase/poly-beta-1,6-N-acetylglucosamine synthase-like glycosyltransferase
MLDVFFGAVLLALSLIFLVIGISARRPKYKIDYFPPVSVISWFWRDGNIVERKIKNFLSQKYPGKFEVIIVDNCSNDETKKICEKFAKKGLIKYYRSAIEYDRKAYALDEAIQKVAKYDIIAMTDPDGICKEDWLANIVQPFKDKRVGAVIGLTHAGNFYRNFFTKLRAVEDEWNYVISPLGRRRLGKSVQLVCGANYAVRRSALKSVGYHGKKTLGEDLELTIKLYAKGWRVRVTNAEVWQEEVESLKEYIRQRLRWIDTGVMCGKYYFKHFVKIAKRRSIGFILFSLSHLIHLFGFVSFLLALLSLLFSANLLIFSLASFIILNFSIIVGLIKFKRKYLIPYVPFFFILEPIYFLYCFFLRWWILIVKKKPIVWRSLYNGYYHRGSEIILK